MHTVLKKMQVISDLQYLHAYRKKAIVNLNIDT